jgi:hypothetical protein
MWDDITYPENLVHSDNVEGGRHTPPKHTPNTIIPGDDSFEPSFNVPDHDTERPK